MRRILDRFRPYITGLKSGAHVRKYKEKKMRSLLGKLLMLKRLCRRSKMAPIQKFSSEARWREHVLTAFCLACLEPETHTFRILE